MTGKTSTKPMALVFLLVLPFCLSLTACEKEKEAGPYDYDVAIIGAGGGGLGCGAALAKEGLKVAVADREAFRKLLHQNFPNEREGIGGFFKTTEAVYDEVVAIGELSQKNLLARLPQYALFPFRFPNLFKYRNATLKDLFDEQVKDPRLQGILAQLWGYLGLPPSQASGLYYAMIWHGLHDKGAYYPKGSTQSKRQETNRRIPCLPEPKL